VYRQAMRLNSVRILFVGLTLALSAELPRFVPQVLTEADIKKASLIISFDQGIGALVGHKARISSLMLFRWKVSNPLLMAAAAVVGLIAFPLLHPAWVMAH
jgi:hypothetical protein